MKPAKRFPSTPAAPRRRIGVGLTTLLLTAVTLPVMAQEASEDESPYIAIRAAEDDTMTISASGRASLTLTRAPASSHDAQLHLVNSDNYSLWSGDLVKQGDRWVAQFDRAAVEAMLKANAVHAEFPAAASDGKDLRISKLRDNLTGVLDNASTLVGSDPLFYEAPEAPEPLEAIGPNPDAIRIESYAMAARRYDEQLAAYRYELLAAKSNATALWTDLKTAGRLPAWPTSVMTAQERALQAIATQAEAIQAQRNEVRATAQAIVDEWNAAHGDTQPISISFREMS